MTDEPVTFVVERHHGVERPSIIVGPLPEWLVAKGQNRLVYALRVDKLPQAEQDFWLKKPCTELLDVYHWLRDEGTLPPANLTDPPRQDNGEKGVLRGEASWWRPPPRYWDPAERTEP
jgi:hypothetical protein